MNCLRRRILFRASRCRSAGSFANSDAAAMLIRHRGVIGSPKSHAGHRTIPLGPFVVNTMREWKLQCPKGELDLVFPTGEGQVENHSNILTRGYWPAQIAAGVTTADKPKYSGLHALRHFYASWCINRKVDGGLELPIKLVQERLGHSSIVMTSDVYGHLFPSRDAGAELAIAEQAFGLA